jgi:hypothetical protein
MLKTLIIATVLLPTLAIAQRSQQLPQPRQPGQSCPVGWMASVYRGCDYMTAVNVHGVMVN